MAQKLTTSEWIALARAVHGDRYDYSRVEYKTARAPVTIVCPEHGTFEQTPTNHTHCTSPRGCPACGRARIHAALINSTEKFIAAARAVHGDRYDYSRAEYFGGNKKIQVVCPAHGIFEPTPGNHVHNRSGCPRCGAARAAVIRAKSTEQFVADARKIHGDRYDYSCAKYRNAKTHVRIRCPEHGEFKQSPDGHLHGHGCPTCGAETGRNKLVFSKDDFIARATHVHGSTYDYGGVEYVRDSDPVVITCPKHGPFRQRPNNHTQGQGCPACGIERMLEANNDNWRSREEIELFDWIAALCPDATHGAIDSTTWLYDVVVPSRKLVIEYNGVYWHSYPRITNASKHIVKRRHAENLGYRMITIWSDEWQNNRPRIEALLRRALGAERPRIVGARQCRIVEIEPALAREFHAAWHIQGGGIGGSHHYGVFLGEELLATATFRKGGTDLDRYTVCEGFALAGALQRILKHHVAATGVTTIVTYCDRDHFIGAGYEAAGFIKTGCHAHLSYAVGAMRQARHRWMKHKAPANFPGVALDMSQREIDVNASQGVFACYNSGVDRWLWSALL